MVRIRKIFRGDHNLPIQNKELDWRKETDRMENLWEVLDQPTVSGGTNW